MAGALLGRAGAAAVSRALEGLLYRVSPTDPVTFLTVPALLAGVALLATVLPALRARASSPRPSSGRSETAWMP